MIKNLTICNEGNPSNVIFVLTALDQKEARRTHDGQKPLKCDRCGAGFTQQSSS